MDVLLASIQKGTDHGSHLMELSAYYFRDKIAPGLQSAWLPDKKLFYVAVHRFTNHSIESRTVVAKATGTDATITEASCMAIWREIVVEVEAQREAAHAKAVSN